MNGKEIDTKFDEVYKSKIEPKLSNLENYRIQEKKKYDFLIMLLFASVICSFFLIF